MTLCKKKLENILKACEQALENQQNLNDLNNLKAAYLGKKGEIAALMMTLKDLSNEEKPKVGKLINEIKQQLEALFEAKKKCIRTSGN